MNHFALVVLLCLARPLSNNSPWFVHGELLVEDNANENNQEEPNRYLRTGSDAAGGGGGGGSENLDAPEEQTGRDLQYVPGFNPRFDQRFNRGFNRGYANGLRTGRNIGFNQAVQVNNQRAQNPRNRFVPSNQRAPQQQRQPQIITDTRTVGLPNQIGGFYYVGGNYRAQSYFANPIYGDVFASGDNLFGPPSIDDVPPDVEVIVVDPGETPSPTGSPTGPTSSPTQPPTISPTTG